MIHRKERCIYKRRKGLFSLSKQPVWNPFRQLATIVKVYGIHIDRQGVQRGHIFEQGFLKKVERLGKAAWTITPLNQAKELAEAA